MNHAHWSQVSTLVLIFVFDTMETFDGFCFSGLQLGRSLLSCLGAIWSCQPTNSVWASMGGVCSGNGQVRQGSKKEQSMSTQGSGAPMWETLILQASTDLLPDGGYTFSAERLVCVWVLVLWSTTRETTMLLSCQKTKTLWVYSRGGCIYSRELTGHWAPSGNSNDVQETPLGGSHFSCDAKACFRICTVED